MDDRNVGYAQGIGSSDIGAFADNLAESLDRQMKIAFEPEERKSLRRFSSTEVASLLRVSTSNLRNRHKDGEALSIRSINHSGVIDVKTFYQLFPGAPLKKATKIAGIPKPASCV